MKYLTYLFFRLMVLKFSLLPFRVIYLFADFAFFVVYRLVGYRKEVVMQNLRNSFPDKGEQEIKSIAIGFYRHFSDLLVESLKSFSMSDQAVADRYRVINPELVDAFYNQGRSAICIAGHYGNWEWGGICAGLQIRHKPVGFYKPLSNKYIDAYIRRTRIKGRSSIAAITHTRETFEQDWGEPALFYMVADQSPSSPRLAYWVNFMNQDTATLHGPEKYARIYNMPVVFGSARKVKRGRYEVEFILVEPEPAETGTGRITGRFMEVLESEIRREPRYYLWSHRRWKLKR